MAWIDQEFERLQALPFAESSAGSEVDPQVAARDVHLAMRLRHRPRHWHAVTGAHLPEQATISVTIDPRGRRAEVSEVLLHELAHATVYVSGEARFNEGTNEKGKFIFDRAPLFLAKTIPVLNKATRVLFDEAVRAMSSHC